MRSALIKACALGLLGLAAIRTAPLMASHGVGHTLQLLDAKEPFLVRAGLGRLHFLLNLESTHRTALESQAVPRILSLLDQPRVDPGEGGEVVVMGFDAYISHVDYFTCEVECSGLFPCPPRKGDVLELSAVSVHHTTSIASRGACSSFSFYILWG